MQPGKTVVGYFRESAEQGVFPSFTPAIVLGVQKVENDESALSLAVFNPAKADLLGGPDWHLAFERKTGVLHGSHGEVKEGKHREYFLEVDVDLALPPISYSEPDGDELKAAVDEIAGAPATLPTLASSTPSSGDSSPETPNAPIENSTANSSSDSQPVHEVKIPKLAGTEHLEEEIAKDAAEVEGEQQAATSSAGTSDSAPASQPSPTTETAESKSSEEQQADTIDAATLNADKAEADAAREAAAQ